MTIHIHANKGKKQVPSKEPVLQWVKKAWQEIPAELVIRSLKSCGNVMRLMGLRMKLFTKKRVKVETSWTQTTLFQNEFHTDSESEDK